MAGNLYQILITFVKECVTMSEENRKLNLETLKSEIEDKLINEMKNIDQLFSELYQNIYYTGSFYDGLRITEANEFDLNIRLKLPFKPSDVEIVHSGIDDGFVKYKLTDNVKTKLALHPKWNIYKGLIDIMDPTFKYFSQVKVNRWLQGLVDKAMRTNPGKFTQFSRSNHGPAVTLQIRTIKNAILDVDLVPVIELHTLPDSVRKISFLETVEPNKKFSFIVPKPVPSFIADKSGLLWRVSIPDVERYIMDDKGCLKLLIRIFKAIRDNYQWKGIASYYIKTLFLYQVEQHPQQNYWKEANMGQLFITMLQELIVVLNKLELNHFFFKRANLLHSIKPPTAKNIAGRLEKILKAAQSDLVKLPDLLRGQQRNGKTTTTPIVVGLVCPQPRAIPMPTPGPPSGARRPPLPTGARPSTISSTSKCIIM